VNTQSPLIHFEGDWFDGRSATRHAVRVEADGQTLRIIGEGFIRSEGLALITVDPPIGRLRRVLRLPSGGELQTDDHDAVRRLFGHRSWLGAMADRIERHWPRVLALAVVLIAATVLLVTEGVPLAARPLAALIPAPVEAAIGRQSLATLDQILCEPADIAPDREARLTAALARLTEGLDTGARWQLVWRDCKAIGANAFALPGGTLVVTTSLLDLLDDDREVVAVLAHEVGHVVGRHGLRLVVQASLGTALVATLLGDAASITSLAYTVPTVLMNSRYQRAMETEADDFAFARLRALGASPEDFARAIEQLVASRKPTTSAADSPDKSDTPDTPDKPPGADGRKLSDYLASHPASAERIERARRAAENH
jgi:Zn-dependent protease with chaperone function